MESVPCSCPLPWVGPVFNSNQEEVPDGRDHAGPCPLPYAVAMWLESQCKTVGKPFTLYMGNTCPAGKRL